MIKLFKTCFLLSPYEKKISLLNVHYILEFECKNVLKNKIKVLNEPRCEKTSLRGFRPGPTQIEL